MKTEHELPPPDPTTRNRYDRFRNEVMAGGSVTERRGDRRGPTGDAGRQAHRRRHPRAAGAAGVRQHVDVHLRRRDHRVGVPARDRPLRHGPADRHEGDAVLPRLRAAPVELPPGRDRVRRAGPAARRLRPHHRHEQHGRGAAGRRGAHVPAADVPPAAARDLGRLDHAHAAGDRPAVRGVLDPGRAGAAAGRRPSRTVQVGGPAAAAGIAPDDVVLSVGGVDVTGADELGAAVRSHEPGDVVAVVVERDGVEQTVRGHARATITDRDDPNFGQALLGVGSSGVHGWAERSIGAAAGNSVDRPVPGGVGQHRGCRQGAQPGQHRQPPQR